MIRSGSCALFALLLVGCGVPAATSEPGAARTIDAGSDAASRNDGAPVSNGAPPHSLDGGDDQAGPAHPPAVADSFEGASLDPRWTVLGAEGHQAPGPDTAVLDRTRAHSGAQSLHIHDGFIETSPPATRFYGRAWVWFGADPGAGHWMAWVGVGPGGAQGTEVRYGGHYDILEANYFGNDDEVVSDPQGYCSPTCAHGVAAPVGRWACVEFYFGQDEIRLWLDGQEIGTLHVTSWRNQAAPWSPAYDRVRLGFHDFAGPPVDVWYDDVALDTARVGCE